MLIMSYRDRPKQHLGAISHSGVLLARDSILVIIVLSNNQN